MAAEITAGGITVPPAKRLARPGRARPGGATLRPRHVLAAWTSSRI